MIDIALTSKSPKYRYKVGLDSKYLVPLVEKLHESTQDMILTNSRIKRVLPAKSPKNGRSLAAGRYYKDWPRFLIICLMLLYVLKKVRQ